jgi:hypothetical protein
VIALPSKPSCSQPIPLAGKWGGFSALAVLLLASACLASAAALVLSAAASGRSLGCPRAARVAPVRTIVRPRWLSGVLITEYFPAPERWFGGRLVRVGGLAGRHRVDWLYSARGLAMQGEGIGRDGRLYRFAGPYSLTWRNGRGAPTYPCSRAPGFWSNGRPAWIGPTWLNRRGQVTYPLGVGGWSNGSPARVERPPAAAQFTAGASLPLSYWHDVAVDPRLIPRGSSVFVPAYCHTPSHGWFTAADTGGAIIGPHIDIFRAPPHKPWDSTVLRRQKIFVVPPGHDRPAQLRCTR